MKKTRKLASLLLALIMVLCFSTSALGAGEGELTGGSITITNAVEKQDYNAYQILYLESYNATTGAYSYKANTDWSEWLATQTDYVSIDAQGYVTWVTNADVAAFAKAASEQLTGKTATGTATVAEGATSVTISGLNLGYYLVDTTLGTICSLDTTNPTVEMQEKNEAPTVTKQVQEDSDDSWGASNDADINQVVNFKTTITVKAGAENYVLHDTMSAGLTFTGVTAVKIGNAEVAAENYTVTSTGLTDGCTFEVAFDDAYIATLAANTQIVVEYSATLNENAVVGLNGNTNEVKLEYGDEADASYTPAATTTTYTWDAKVIKYTMNGETEKMLDGATFEVALSAETGYTALKFHDLTNNQYQHCADTACVKTHVTSITTDTTGTFTIQGLDAATYYLHETKAPAGYNKLAGPATLTVTGATEEGTPAALTYSTVEAKVENKTGSELPSTGGIGTTPFYLIGGGLVLVALVLLIVKKRMAGVQ